MEPTTTVGQKIPEKLFYKASEVCQITDTQPYVLRFWESEFPQLASEKNRSGQRVYRKKDIDLVFRIKKLLYQEEYTIAGARKAIDEDSGTIVEPPPKPRSRREAPVEEKGEESAPAAASPASLFGESHPEVPEAAAAPAPPPAAGIEERHYQDLYENALVQVDVMKAELSESKARLKDLRERSNALAARIEAALES